MAQPAWTVIQWLQLIGFGAVAGAIGQSARTVVGLKKLDDGKDPGTALSDNIDASRLFVSILIGAVAGVLAASGTVHDLNSISPELFLGIVVAGYSGSDFIEGFMRKATSGGSGPKPDQPAKPVANDGAVG